MKKQSGFFDLEDHYTELSKAGAPLERLLNVVNFEAFRYRLNKALKRSDSRQGGRPADEPSTTEPMDANQRYEHGLSMAVKGTMGLFICSIGLVRARTKIASQWQT